MSHEIYVATCPARHAPIQPVSEPEAAPSPPEIGPDGLLFTANDALDISTSASVVSIPQASLDGSAERMGRCSTNSVVISRVM